MRVWKVNQSPDPHPPLRLWPLLQKGEAKPRGVVGATLLSPQTAD